MNFVQWWNMPGRRRGLLLVLVMALALTLRCVWIAHVHPIPHTDFAWYRDKAIGIEHGLGYVNNGRPTAYFPIGYPLFLAGVYAIFGTHWFSGVFANVLLSTATAGLVFLVADRLHGWRAGLIAGVLMACYVPHIEWASVLCSEMLFTFLFLLTVYLWVVRSPKKLGWGWLVASGLVLGLACIVRPVLLLLPGALLIYLWISKVGWWQGILRTGVVVLVMLVTISPVTIRNYVQFHHVIPVSTNGGVNLWQGNNEHANGAYYWPSDAKLNPFLNYVQNEVDDNQKASHLALSYIKHHPMRTIQLGFTKWKHLFQGVDNAEFWSVGQSVPPVRSSTVHAISAFSWWEYTIILGLAVIGVVCQAVFMVRSRDRRFIMVWLAMAYYVGLFFIFPAWDRMRAPVDPWFVVLAGVSLAAMLRGRKFFYDSAPAPVSEEDADTSR